MTIHEALSKAVEGGYQVSSHDGVEIRYSGANSEYSAWTRTDNQSSFLLCVEETFLDPLFWRALGLALGWQEQCNKPYLAYDQWWRQAWHRFIDHLAEGKTPETFFAIITPEPQKSAAMQEPKQLCTL